MSVRGLMWSDEDLVAALRGRDEQQLDAVVREWTPMMLRVARATLGTATGAEDVVQDAWLVVLSSIDRFEGRSALRTWVLGIVLNVARRTAARQRRIVPLGTSWWQERAELGRPAVDPDRFDPATGGWVTPPLPWDQLPEEALGASELRGVVEAAIDELPPRQAAVVTARDVLGLPGEEVAALFGLTEGNQRVLLHRARARLRTAVERYAASVHYDAMSTPPPERDARPAAGRPSARRPAPPKPDQPVVCRQLVELVDDYLERRLDQSLRLRIEEHLGACDACSGYVRQVQRMLELTGRLAGEAPGEIVHRLAAVLRGHHT